MDFSFVRMIFLLIAISSIKFDVNGIENQALDKSSLGNGEILPAGKNQSAFSIFKTFNNSIIL